ncbi:MAG: GNAT family N-acetyltransferase [Caulobacter sp.]|nr:GNAT family N-acetyltransferase [Caulobacter sp.]
MDIRRDDLTHPSTLALLSLHLAGMHANSPPGTVFALDLSGLKAPDVTVWTAWEGELACGVGALRQLDAENGEVKSMRTHPDHLRKGVAALLLDTVILAARERKFSRLSLETGRGPAFEPALALYRRRGFVDGGRFSDYEDNGFSQFLHLDLRLPAA